MQVCHFRRTLCLHAVRVCDHFPPHILRLLQMHESVVKGKGNLPDELLYGRVGYLYSLIFINQQFGHEKVPSQYIQQVRPCYLNRC